ncbi:MAG: type II toxin-antitoxin system RelE/ParE family toxin [Burkholderiaceae bacterium]|nr:type II toxin-antitoxin system RelE/ParE family toxin [Burkholderiaceae bacterium]
MRRYRLSVAAQHDLIAILAWAHEHFGAAARKRYETLIVRRPRHFLIYRMEGDIVVVARLLHDAMEPARHLDPDESWE